jgi:hypothetical protein
MLCWGRGWPVGFKLTHPLYHFIRSDVLHMASHLYDTLEPESVTERPEDLVATALSSTRSPT